MGARYNVSARRADCRYAFRAVIEFRLTQFARECRHAKKISE